MTGTMKHKYYSGAIDGMVIAIIALSVGVAVTGSLSVWMYMQYNDQRTDVESKIDLAVADAKRDQAEDLEQQFQDRANAHTVEFVGPEDYGRLVFMYPRDWSVYTAEDGSSNRYEAYLHPRVVPKVRAKERFALRVLIENKAYDDILKKYQSKVDKGELKSSVITFSGHTGTRLDGQFNKDIRGSAVIFRVRDKTVTLQTDADTFKPLFNKLMDTVDFNA